MHDARDVTERVDESVARWRPERDDDVFASEHALARRDEACRAPDRSRREVSRHATRKSCSRTTAAVDANVSPEGCGAAASVHVMRGARMGPIFGALIAQGALAIAKMVPSSSRPRLSRVRSDPLPSPIVAGLAKRADVGHPILVERRANEARRRAVKWIVAKERRQRRAELSRSRASARRRPTGHVARATRWICRTPDVLFVDRAKPKVPFEARLIRREDFRPFIERLRLVPEAIGAPRGAPSSDPSSSIS